MPGAFGHLQIIWHYWIELRKDGVHSRRDEEEALAFLLTKAKSPKKMDITLPMRDAILSWQSHLQANQTWGPHSPSLPSLRESTSLARYQDTSLFGFFKFLTVLLT